MRKICLFTFSLIPFLSISQTVTHQLALDWDKPGVKTAENVIIGNDEEDLLFFSGASFSDLHSGLPVYYAPVRVSSSGPFQVKLVNPTYSPVESDGFLRSKGIENTEALATAEPAMEKGRSLAMVTVFPFRYNPAAGSYEKLVSATVQITGSQSSPLQLRSTQFAANSVLASGSWYKISVDRDGIYKLDYTFLKNLGLDVDNIDPRNIRVYGNGSGMLPEKNSDPRIDDLSENAIVVSGEQDGDFNQDDYILFYGRGPDKWLPAEVTVNNKTFTSFKHTKNLYDTKSYYFITVSGPGKRITSQASFGNPNYTVTQFDDYAFHEEELANLNGSGRKWYGQKFDRFNTTGNFSFVFPNLVSDTMVVFYSNLMGRSVTASSLSGFQVRANGQSIYSQTYGEVSSDYTAAYGQEMAKYAGIYNLNSTLDIDITFLPSQLDPETEGRLDFIAAVARRLLIMSGTQMIFRDLHSVAPGRNSLFQLQSASPVTVWDLTDPFEIHEQLLTNSGGNYSFNLPTDTLRTFVAFTGSSFLSAVVVGKVANQDIHGTIGQPDLVIVTYKDFENAAQNLANHHRMHDGMTVYVAELDKIYNEFSSGAQDITAVRDMMRMLYVKANGDSLLQPLYLLMMGDASYDFKNIKYSAGTNTNFVPAFQSYESLHRSSTFVTDDYFGFLDVTEGDNILSSNHKLDIAIGRLTVKSSAEADIAVAKIILYTQPEALGNWRNILTFVADDEDGNTHLSHAEQVATASEADYPKYNYDKIYFDAYGQVSTPGGNRYPNVNTAINNRIFTGTLLLNYAGHGGENGWAEERTLTFDDINSWKNKEKLPLFITATCSFSRYDNPSTLSAGEVLLTKEDGGAIALISTVRLVYTNTNLDINKKLFEFLFEPVNGKMPTLGEVVRLAKNNITSGEGNRKFALLGDPALTLAYPKDEVVTTMVDAHPYVSNQDTLKALSKVTLSGELRDQNGNKMNNFNGVVYVTLYDKALDVSTLRNDQASAIYHFDLFKNIIYKGKASVNNGDFSSTFIVPKDISYMVGPGRISYYAENGQTDAHGYNPILVGGAIDSAATDNKGPEVKLFMNDEKFVLGGITNENPLLLVKLYDDNGINTAGSAIGHDISGLLDEDDQNRMVLNEFYEAALDDYQRGEVRYPLNDLAPGRHIISVKAWDVYNNSGEGFTEFIVAESSELALDHVLNYPNPFTTHTSFWFEHNRPGEPLSVQIRIYSVAGKLLKTIEEDVLSSGFRVDGIEWDGLDDYGDRIGKGVYVYQVRVRSGDGATAQEFEKLVVLR